MSSIAKAFHKETTRKHRLGHRREKNIFANAGTICFSGFFNPIMVVKPMPTWHGDNYLLFNSYGSLGKMYLYFLDLWALCDLRQQKNDSKNRNKA